MSIIVQKYGGSSLKNSNCIKKIAEKIKETALSGNSLIVVASAKYGRTNELIAKAREFSTQPNKRELDALLCIGEIETATLLTIALHAIGISATSMNAFQIGIHTNSDFGDAKITSVDCKRISELLPNKVIIATGFQGIDCNSNFTTLGRGGSDLTALILAKTVNADKCEIYTDVDGVHLCDPKIVPQAQFIHEISHQNCLRLSLLDNKIMHDRAITFAMQNDINFLIKNSLGDTGRMTNVSCQIVKEKQIIGVTCKKNLILLKLNTTFEEFNNIIKFFHNQNIQLNFVKSSSLENKLFVTEIAITHNEFLVCENDFLKNFVMQNNFRKIPGLNKIDIVGCDLQSFDRTEDIIRLFNTQEIARYEYGKFGLSFLVRDNKFTECIQKLNNIIDRHQ